MALLPILTYPHTLLRFHTTPVTEFGAGLQTLIDNMFETMYASQGVGLAATQVGVKHNIIVMDVASTRDEPQVLINGKLLASRGIVDSQEGCLSFPDVTVTVKRAEWVHVVGVDRHGQPLELQAEGLLAVCLQHELDHNNGIVFTDHVSPLKRQMVLKKMEKRQRAQRDRVNE